MRLPRPAFAVVLPLMVATLSLAALFIPLPRSDAPGPDDSDRILVDDLLASVSTVPRRVHVIGYDRENFGGWTPRVTGAGHLCTTRDIVLFSVFGMPPRDDDATGGARSPTDCPRASGTARDVYTGDAMSPGDVEIDHVFPLSAAWDHGAWDWPRSRRTAFANDVDRNLLAVSSAANQAKSDGTPAEWLPSAGGSTGCAYVARYLTVAAAYALSVSVADADTARTVCRR